MGRFATVAAVTGVLGGLLWLFVPEFVFTHAPHLVPDAYLPLCLLSIPLLSATAEAVRRRAPDAVPRRLVYSFASTLLVFGLALSWSLRTGRVAFGVLLLASLAGLVAVGALLAITTMFAHRLHGASILPPSLTVLLAFAVPLDLVAVVYSVRVLGVNVSLYGLVWGLVGTYLWLAEREQAEPTNLHPE